jgi:hypothetical protein
MNYFSSSIFSLYNYFYTQPQPVINIVKPTVVITNEALLQGISNLKSRPNLGRNIYPVDSIKNKKYFRTAPKIIDDMILNAVLINLKPIQPVKRPVFFPPRQPWLRDIQEGNFRLKMLTKI